MNKLHMLACAFLGLCAPAALHAGDPAVPNLTESALRTNALTTARTAPQALREAVRDLSVTFGPRYPNGAAYLARLDAIEKADLTGASAEFLALQREALLANPLVSGQPLAYVVRSQYAGDHHNTETMFQTGECNTGSFRGPGALKTIDLKTGRTNLLVNVPEGIARDPEVRWDGKKIVFSKRANAKDDYHIYEIDPDGSGVKQLTFGSGITDIDPFYLADGSTPDRFPAPSGSCV